MVVITSIYFPLLALAEKILDGLVNVFLVLDARKHEIIDVGDIVIELADELAASVGTFHLAVTEQIDLRENVRFQEMDASIGVSPGPVVAVGEVENIDVPELLR